MFDVALALRAALARPELKQQRPLPTGPWQLLSGRLLLCAHASAQHKPTAASQHLPASTLSRSETRVRRLARSSRE